jgi:predicted RNA binding protein YcfA (HicA-like mRNA interferase family)
MKIPPMKPKQIVAALLKAGFYIHHQRGSHARLLHRTKTEARVTVPIHNKDLPSSFIKHRILKQAGLSDEEFLSLL